MVVLLSIICLVVRSSKQFGLVGGMVKPSMESIMYIKCVDCGALASSKCPACRSIFPQEEYLAMLRSQISFEETKPTEGEGKYFRREMIIKIDMYDGESMEDCLRRLFTTGRDILNQEENPKPEEETKESVYISRRSYRLPSVKKLLCDHRWAPADENQHSSIGCGHY